MRIIKAVNFLILVLNINMINFNLPQEYHTIIVWLIRIINTTYKLYKLYIATMK